MAVIFNKLTATLPSDINTHVFTDSLINNNSVIEIYCNDDDVFPVDVNQTGEHSITVEFSEHSDDVEIALTINNATTFEPYDDTDVLISINELSADKQDKLTAGENITIENNVISSTGGSGGASSLTELDDVNVTSPQNGLPLIYDSITHKWTQSRLSSYNVYYEGHKYGEEDIGAIIDDLTDDIDAIESDYEELAITVNNNYTELSGNITSNYNELSAKYTELSNDKQDTLTAGENITIEDNVISATGGSGGNSNIYSLEETVIGEFLGKTLYRKVYFISTTGISIGTSKTDVNQYVTNRDVIETIVTATLIRPTGVNSTGNFTSQGAAYIENGVIKLYSGSTSTNNMTHFLLEYTKKGE